MRFLMFAGKIHISQIYFGITCGGVLSGELYTQRLQKLIFLYLSTGCFVEFSPLSSGLSIDDLSSVLTQFLVGLCC